MEAPCDAAAADPLLRRAHPSPPDGSSRRVAGAARARSPHSVAWGAGADQLQRGGELDGDCTPDRLPGRRSGLPGWVLDLSSVEPEEGGTGPRGLSARRCSMRSARARGDAASTSAAAAQQQGVGWGAGERSGPGRSSRASGRRLPAEESAPEASSAAAAGAAREARAVRMPRQELFRVPAIPWRAGAGSIGAQIHHGPLVPVQMPARSGRDHRHRAVVRTVRLLGRHPLPGLGEHHRVSGLAGRCAHLSSTHRHTSAAATCCAPSASRRPAARLNGCCLPARRRFIANLNSTDAGGFGLFSDFLTLCINNQASSFTELESTQAGVRACLADSTFQSTVGGSVTGVWPSAGRARATSRGVGRRALLEPLAWPPRNAMRRAPSLLPQLVRAFAAGGHDDPTPARRQRPASAGHHPRGELGELRGVVSRGVVRGGQPSTLPPWHRLPPALPPWHRLPPALPPRHYPPPPLPPRLRVPSLTARRVPARRVPAPAQPRVRCLCAAHHAPPPGSRRARGAPVLLCAPALEWQLHGRWRSQPRTCRVRHQWPHHWLHGWAALTVAC